MAADATNRPEAERASMQRSGSRLRLFSFLDVCTFPPAKVSMERSLAAGCGVFLDSGAFAFQRRPSLQSNRRKLFRQYAKFLLTEGHRFDAYGNFDWRCHSREVWETHHELESRGLWPIATIHGDDGLDWMERYIDAGHVYLAVGAGPRFKRTAKLLRYLDAIFDKAEKKHGNVLLHGFGMTGLEILLRFPWYSVDSKSWLMLRNFGRVLSPLNGRLEEVSLFGCAVTDYPDLAECMRQHGFDLQSMLPGCGSSTFPDYVERGIWNMFVLEHLRELRVRPSGGAWGKWRFLLS